MPLARARFVVLALALVVFVSAAPAVDPKTAPRTADDADKLLLDLVMTPTGTFAEAAFTKGQYQQVRKAFTKYFEAKHGPALKSNLGDDAGPLFDWLNANPEVKETLFTAIDPADDDPAAVDGRLSRLSGNTTRPR